MRREKRTGADMSGYRFSVIVARNIDGWEAYCPDFPDCRARGPSYEDAVDNLRDLVQVLVEDGLGDDETLPRPEALSLTMLDLAL
jgi:predicted RNase H-like HicB family nuclease